MFRLGQSSNVLAKLSLLFAFEERKLLPTSLMKFSATKITSNRTTTLFIRIVKLILENSQGHYFGVVDIVGRVTGRRSFNEPLPLVNRPPLPPRPPRDENFVFDFDGGSLETLL